jgi:RNA polymerase sigma factor (sigma-70 family)
MPRTESGPATYNRSPEWDLTNGHSPITERDRRDARFRNSTGKPPRKGKQTVGPATSVARSNLNPGESVFDGEPSFDRGRFKTGHRLDYTDYRLPDYEDREVGRLTVAERDTNTGAAVPAVCADASCGGNASAKSTAKFGSTSYENLNRRARTLVNLVAATVPGAPLYFGRIAAAAIMEHKLFRPKKIKHADASVTIEHVFLVRHNGRLLKHIGFRCWFGQKYPYRWDQPASCYLDVRIDGKATNSADLTMSQAAAAMADEAFDNLSTRRYGHEGHRCQLLCFFLLWLVAGLDPHIEIRNWFGLRDTWRDFWLYVEEPPNPEKEPGRRHCPSNIYWRRLAAGGRISKLVSLAELQSVHLPRLDRYYRERFREVGKTNRDKRPAARTERDTVIADHWPLAKKKCRIVPQAYRADAIQACMERLVKEWDQYDPERGVSWVAQKFDWAIQDFMKELRRQVPVQRSINLNDPADNNGDDDDDYDKPPESERPDMMGLDTLQKQAAAAKRRLIAERLGCLSVRERRVIEGRLALNGYGESVTHDDLAAELGMSARQIRRIEDAAVEKLRGAML